MQQSTIYGQIKQKFQELTSNSISDDGDIGIRMNVIAGEIANIYEHMDFCKKQMFPQTATGEFLEHHAQIRDIKRIESNKANGKIKFSRNTPAITDIIIPIGTICGTSDNGNSIVYTTTEVSKISKGQSSVLVSAQASEFGAIGNIAANKINVLISGVAGIDSVTNPENFIGGMDRENDESLRKRIVNSYLNISNGSNLKFYEDLAMSVKNVWSAKAIVNSEDSSKVELYITDMFRQPTSELIKQVEEVIKNARELNVNVQVKPANVEQIDVNLKVIVKDLNANGSAVGDVGSFISDKIYNLKIGEDFNPYTIGSGIKDVVEGFENLIFTSPNNLKTVESNQILEPRTVDVSVERR